MHVLHLIRYIFCCLLNVWMWYESVFIQYWSNTRRGNYIVDCLETMEQVIHLAYCYKEFVTLKHLYLRTSVFNKYVVSSNIDRGMALFSIIVKIYIFLLTKNVNQKLVLSKSRNLLKDHVFWRIVSFRKKKKACFGMNM